MPGVVRRLFKRCSVRIFHTAEVGTSALTGNSVHKAPQGPRLSDSFSFPFLGSSSPFQALRPIPIPIPILISIPILQASPAPPGLSFAQIRGQKRGSGRTIFKKEKPRPGEKQQVPWGRFWLLVPMALSCGLVLVAELGLRSFRGPGQPTAEQKSSSEAEAKALRSFRLLRECGPSWPFLLSQTLSWGHGCEEQELIPYQVQPGDQGPRIRAHPAVAVVQVLHALGKLEAV